MHIAEARKVAASVLGRATKLPMGMTHSTKQHRCCTEAMRAYQIAQVANEITILVFSYAIVSLSASAPTF